MLLLFKKHADTLIEQTKTCPQETLEFKMNKQMEKFSLSSPKKLIEEGKWLLTLPCFETMNFVFIITDKNNSFSITISDDWQTKSDEKSFDEINKLLEIRSLELHVKEVRKRGNEIKIGDYGYKLSDFNTQKKEILEEFKIVKYNDLVDLVYRFQLTYVENIDILDL